MVLGAVLALAAVATGPARAGTYTFSFQESIVDDRLAGPAVHGTFAALRDTSVAVAGWHGPRVRTTAGGHTAGSFAMLDLLAPSPAKFVQSSVVVRYRGCSKEADGGFWVEASAIVGQSEALGTRRTLPPFDGCTEVAAEHPGSSTIARPDRIRFKLGSTKTDSSHAAGTSLLINQITGTIEDVTAPTVTAMAATGTTTGAARVVTWSAADGQAGPRSVTLRVTGPNGFVLAPAGWTGTAAPNRACIAGQHMSGCQTTVSGAASITLPAVTGTYTAATTVTDGAGNVAVRTLDLARVAAPTVASAPSIGGVAQVGQTLTLAGGTFGNGPTAVTYSFYRRAGGILTLVQTAGASRSYVVGRADHGSTIVGRVTGSNGAGSALVDSPASAVVLPGLPSGGTPVIDGLPAIVDGQLAVVPGTWDNGGAPGRPTVTAVRWYSCATACALVGHSATYVPTAADVGRRLSAEVDVVNAGGTATARDRADRRRHLRSADAGQRARRLRAGAGRRDAGGAARGRRRARRGGGRRPRVVHLPRRRDRLLHRGGRSGRDAPDRRGRARPAPAGARRRAQRRRRDRRLVGADRARAGPQRVRAGGAGDDHGLRRRLVAHHGRGVAEPHPRHRGPAGRRDRARHHRGRRRPPRPRHRRARRARPAGRRRCRRRLRADVRAGAVRARAA